ncbi:hypothetical protein GCM10020221_24150 [Streptomyces thioluteus]|uniref:Secreted protein n=1 Tax=Streptomyces thioluteus TaxID=66431 RepID=A0ABP6JAS2_STRTU
MYVRKRIALTVTTAVLGGVLAAAPSMAAAPGGTAATAASAGAVHTADSRDGAELRTTWKHVWGPAKISADYLNKHGKHWESQNFTLPRPANSAKITLKCWNNHDGGEAQVRFKDTKTGRIVAGTGWKPCDWTEYHAIGNYYTGHPIRVLLDVRGHAHTTDVTAYRGY